MIIYDALEFVRKELNAYLKPQKDGSKDDAVLSSVVLPNGDVPEDAKGRVVLTLINVEREGAASGPPFYAQSDNGHAHRLSASLNLNLYVLVTGIHDKYSDALKLLSKAITFFQGRPVFTSEDVPAVTKEDTLAPFPAGLQRLTFEVFNLQLQDMSHLWGALGAKYQPSIIYKVRMLTFQEAWVSDTLPLITGGETSLEG